MITGTQSAPRISEFSLGNEGNSLTLSAMIRWFWACFSCSDPKRPNYCSERNWVVRAVIYDLKLNFIISEGAMNLRADTYWKTNTLLSILLALIELRHRAFKSKVKLSCVNKISLVRQFCLLSLCLINVRCHIEYLLGFIPISVELLLGLCLGKDLPNEC